MEELSFTCKRCGYETKYKNALIRHLEKKNACRATLDNIDVHTLSAELRKTKKEKTHKCVACNKSYSQAAGLWRHKQKCTSIRDPTDHNADETQMNVDSSDAIAETRGASLENVDEHDQGSTYADVSQDALIQLQDFIKRELRVSRQELIKEIRQELIDEIRQELKRDHTCTTHTTVQGDNTVNSTSNRNSNNNHHTYLVINNFGSEDVSHIIDDKQFLDKCLLKLQSGIPDVVNRIYYDDSKPQNKTVKLKSSKRNTAMVHADGKWQEQHLNQVVPAMVKKGSKILSHHLMQKDIPSDDEELQEIALAKQEFIADVMTQKKPEYDTVSSAVKATICNHR